MADKSGLIRSIPVGEEWEVNLYVIADEGTVHLQDNELDEQVGIPAELVDDVIKALTELKSDIKENTNGKPVSS